ncbi:hypothetical protein F4677DRAFT_449610 [Hypoxylon crocopeplum]|nr:hypothetical protein F4677DRAFT_449610 [Hypoxylon crocopeplum]
MPIPPTTELPRPGQLVHLPRSNDSREPGTPEEATTTQARTETHGEGSNDQSSDSPPCSDNYNVSERDSVINSSHLHTGVKVEARPWGQAMNGVTIVNNGGGALPVAICFILGYVAVEILRMRRN